MSTTFLSYARTDLDDVLPLLEVLSDNGLEIWRDQEKIHGGEKWPKILGEAIDQQDDFLLIWSKQASKSHFVELEWCTALALKKKIISLRLDDTQLPASLRSLETIQASERSEAISRILKAAHQPSEQTNPSRSAEVIKTLGSISHSEPNSVLSEATQLFHQEGWVVRGDNYQAGRDMNITNVTFPVPKVAMLAGFALLALIAIGWIIYPTNGPNSDMFEQELGGIIYDEEGLPIAGVEVSSSKYQKTAETNSKGAWRFSIQGPKQETIQISAEKEPDYEATRASGTLGNKEIRFILYKKQP